MLAGIRNAVVANPTPVVYSGFSNGGSSVVFCVLA